MYVKLQTYRCAARETRYIAVEVQAGSLEDAKRLFREGKWDDIVDEHLAETEAIECDLSEIHEIPAKE